jgi:hypothetical protein
MSYCLLFYTFDISRYRTRNLCTLCTKMLQFDPTATTSSIERKTSEADSLSAGQELPAFHGSRTFITVFTTARLWYLSWARWIQFTHSHLISLRSTLKSGLYYHLRLGQSSGLFSSGFPLKILYAIISYMRSTFLAYIIHLNLATIATNFANIKQQEVSS